MQRESAPTQLKRGPMVFRLKKLPFNLVEIVGALVIIAFGVTAAMALLQPSIRASRDSVGDNYSSDVANQFMSYIQVQARQNWTSIVGTDSAFTSAPPSAPATIADSNIDTPGSWGGAVGSGNIYTTGGILSAASGIYGARCGNDFSGHVKVWKMQITDFSFNGTTTSLPKSKAVRFQIEISYPANKPYSARDKKYYSIEVFNQ